MIVLQGQEPLAFFEEVIPRGVYLVRKGIRGGFAGEPATQREQSIQGSANSNETSRPGNP